MKGLLHSTDQVMTHTESDTQNNPWINPEKIISGLIIPAFVFALLTLPSCTFSPNRFKLEDIAKSDVNQIAEIHLQRASDLIEKLSIKMYKRNPDELSKTENRTIEESVEKIIACPSPGGYRELNYNKGTDAILLGLSKDFQGDRVFAVMYGLYSMLLKSYENKCEFFFTDHLDQQKLYNSARNIEILVWRLKTRVDANGAPLLLTNCTTGPVINISYERLFGKLISLQDTLAVIVSERTSRTIKKVVHFTGMSFLPVGL